MSGEMQPDEWPKYRYLILELWDPADEKIAKVIKDDLTVCRVAVMRSAFKRALATFCADHVVQEQNVSTEQREAVLKGVVGNYEKFLSNVRKKQPDLTMVAAALKEQLGVLSASDAPAGEG